ncbi:MAG: hypothetical protein H7Y11_15725 [Armatimonadetes bacterium]|nr:hypothetical protein [Anaerolineae bacterium]
MKTLVNKIEMVFEPIKYPGDTLITYTNDPYHLEAVEIAQALQGKHWKSLTNQELRYHAASLSFFTPQAFCFYLPAYMIASITGYKLTDILTQSLVGNLTMPTKPEASIARFLANVAPLSTMQSKAVLDYLEYTRATHGEDFSDRSINRAINRYWNRYRVD